MILSLLPLMVGQVYATPVPGRGPAKQKQVSPLLKPGTKAPDFRTTTVDGKTVTLSSLKGKVVILDFWATWCGPCLVSMPSLQKIYKDVKKQGVVVLSVNTWDEKPEFVKWVKENAGTKYDFTFVRDPAEGDHDAIRAEVVQSARYPHDVRDRPEGQGGRRYGGLRQ
jgi:thiol-disulfide isomerase/thioredoxin